MTPCSPFFTCSREVGNLYSSSSISFATLILSCKSLERVKFAKIENYILWIHFYDILLHLPLISHNAGDLLTWISDKSMNYYISISGMINYAKIIIHDKL